MNGRIAVGEIRETYRNVDKGYICGESSWCEPFTDIPGKLFSAMQKDHGRCCSKLYRDYNSQVLVCGWVFVKKARYEGAPGYFLLETWVEVRWIYKFAN